MPLLPEVIRGQYVTAHVVFVDDALHPTSPGWFRLFMRTQRYNHCWAMQWTGRRWVAFDVHSLAIDVVELAAWPELPRMLAHRGATIVEVARYRAPRWYWRGLTTCVSSVKMLLGIRAWWVVTPDALYRWLLREGQREVEHG